MSPGALEQDSILEYEALSETLREYLKETTQKLIASAIHNDTSDGAIVSELAESQNIPILESSSLFQY